MIKPLIALDADGVLLDYHLAYASVWERVFGERPRERDPLAYWPTDRWAVEQLEGEPLLRLRAGMDELFWSTVPAIDSALDACLALHAAGHQLVCVSALPSQFADARLRNLKDLGFPIDSVIATGRAEGVDNPKAEVVSRLQPQAFVDDYLPFLTGLPPQTHAALVLRQPNGSPNVGPGLQAVHSQHADLADFVQWWLLEEQQEQRKRT